MQPLNDSFFLRTDEGFKLTLNKKYRAVYGLGEKFDNVNQKGSFVRACVREKCFYQGEYTYLSMPFFMTPDGFGVYVDTYAEVDFDFTCDDKIEITIFRPTDGKIPPVYLLEGTLKEILTAYRKLTSMPKVFPKWSLGAFMSANRWKYDYEIEEQLALAEKYNFPHNVIVIEPWSDVSTHYLFNGMESPLKPGDGYVKLSECDFSSSDYWKDPVALINKIHAANMHVILWVVPVYAQGVTVETQTHLEQLANDIEYVKKSGECVLNADGTPYEIPHTWCIGSMVPDFTDKVGTKHWFDRYSYLLEMGVDGFKTDGGEFIHDKTVKFSDGTTGVEGQNAYPEQYTHAFADFVGDKGIVFSRAGGQNSPSFSLIWAGDQESTWSEYRSVLKAGLSAGLSGINNWGYDIAGFSGYLPTAELYLRATQAAAFFPVMQWHSDPVGNGRCDFSGAWKTNDRSPWNMAAYLKDESLLGILRKQFFLHYNLLPYLYSLMLEAHETGIPSLRALALEFPDDERTYSIENEFMLGSALLVAPVTDDYIEEETVYLPQGTWYGLYDGKKYDGGEVSVRLCRDYTPAFMRDNSCIPLNLNGGKLFSDVGNRLDGYCELTFLLSGFGAYTFTDDLGNKISFTWTRENHTITENEKHLPVRFLQVGVDKLI